MSNKKNNILFVDIKKDYPENNEWDETNKLIKDFYQTAEIKNYRFSIIFNITKLGNLEFKKYKDWINLFNRLKNKTEKYINKTCIVVNNKIIKTSINLFLRIYKPIRPMKIVDNIQQSLDYINNKDT